MSENKEHEGLIAEAREFSDGWVRDSDEPAPRPFDQADRIRHWENAGEPTTQNRDERRDDIAKWEKLHGHDVRLKCYPEFGCQVIESYAADLVIRLLAALESRPPVPVTPTPTEPDGSLWRLVKRIEKQAMEAFSERDDDRTWTSIFDEMLLAALSSTPVETEENWEWRVESENFIDQPINKDQALAWLRDDAERGKDSWLMRRRPAGPWLPVTEEKK